jgi:hypothetical protein
VTRPTSLSPWSELGDKLVVQLKEAGWLDCRLPMLFSSCIWSHWNSQLGDKFVSLVWAGRQTCVPCHVWLCLKEWAIVFQEKLPFFSGKLVKVAENSDHNIGPSPREVVTPLSESKFCSQSVPTFMSAVSEKQGDSSTIEHTQKMFILVTHLYVIFTYIGTYGAIV